MLENTVRDVSNLRRVKTTAKIEETESGAPLTYDQYLTLLLSACAEFDKSKSGTKDRRSSRRVYYSCDPTISMMITTTMTTTITDKDIAQRMMTSCMTCHVADGHLTPVPLGSVYSGVMSLREFRLVMSLAELNGLPLWSTDIGKRVSRNKDIGARIYRSWR